MPFNLTLSSGSTIQSLNISILDDDLVEQSEVIQLLLIILTTGMFATDPDSTQIEITDNDGET